MVLSLLTAAVLSADPGGYSVVVARRIGFEAGQAREFAESLARAVDGARGDKLGRLRPVPEVSAALSTAGFPDTAVCSGATACVSSLARLSGLPYLVSLQVVKVGSSVALDASVVESSSGQSLSVVTRTLKVKDLDKELPALAKALLAPLPALPPVVDEPPPPPPPLLVTDDTPRDVTLTPPPKEPPPEVVATPSMPTGRKVALGLGGAAVVALGVGIALGVTAMSQSNTLSTRAPDYAQQAAAVKQTALTADVLYGASALLAGSAAAAWLLSPADVTAR